MPNARAREILLNENKMLEILIAAINAFAKDYENDDFQFQNLSCWAKELNGYRVINEKYRGMSDNDLKAAVTEGSRYSEELPCPNFGDRRCRRILENEFSEKIYGIQSKLVTGCSLQCDSLRPLEDASLGGLVETGHFESPLARQEYEDRRNESQFSRWAFREDIDGHRNGLFFRSGHSASTRALEAAVDLLGPLRPMVGPKPADPKQDAKRKWKGHGFNLIWRPNFVRSEGSEFGQKEFFLQLNLTDEELDFTEITGTGIANRSLFEDTITLGGIAYTQAIKDSFDQSGQHFEPGVWANVPQTANPEVPPTIVRMGSIPHGTTINLQGTATDLVATTPTFDPASITPFVIGDPGKTPYSSTPRRGF